MSDPFFGNMLFWIVPYLAMIFYQLPIPFFQKRLTYHQTSAIQMYCLLISLPFVYQIFVFPHTIILGVFPDYLLYFYLAGVFWLSIFYLDLFPSIKSIFQSFLVIYVGSFVWEIPINIRCLLESGYHSAIILHLLGVFPYIFLYSITKPPKKNMIILSFLPIVFTSMVLLVYPIHDIYLQDWGYSFSVATLLQIPCRIVTFVCLGVLFRPKGTSRIIQTLNKVFNKFIDKCLFILFIPLFILSRKQHRQDENYRPSHK